MGLEKLFPADTTTQPTAKYVFAAIVALLLVVAAGQWYLLGGFTALYLGVPLWLWFQLVIVVGMLALAWVAMGIWTATNEDSSPGGHTGDGGSEW
jgi:hypothetical protein